MKENNSFTMAKMKIKYLGVKLARNVQNLYHKIILHFSKRQNKCEQVKRHIMYLNKKTQYHKIVSSP